MSPATEPAAPISLKDLTIENITSNVHAINSICPDPRLKFILERVVVHLHDLARETRLSTAEWMQALLFLTEVGQISSDVRQVCSSNIRRLGAASQYGPALIPFSPGIYPSLRHLRPFSAG